MNGVAVGGEPPPSVRELRLWLAGGERLGAALGSFCEVYVLRPGAPPEPAGGRAAFLLVEAGEAGWDPRGEDLERLLEVCRRAGVPRFVWFVASPLDPAWLERCERFDRAFAVERWRVPDLQAAGAREPTTLWPATALPVDAGPADVVPAPDVEALDAEGRDDTVVWLGGWRPQWPAAWQERLASVLRGAARRGLRIVPAARLEGLPPDLESCVVPVVDGAAVASLAEQRAALRRAKVAIGADPTVASPTYTPEVVFDAAACGAAVLTPHDFAAIHEFGVGSLTDGSWRNTIPIVHDGDITVEEIDRLLDDRFYRAEVVGHLRRVVAYNHTYENRLATLASAAGLRLIPDAHRPALA